MAITKRYKPRKLSDLKGNPKAHKQLKELIERGSRVLLSGPSGIGKTEAVYAIANELKMKVIEINASDERRSEDLKDVSRRCQMFSVTGEKMIYLLDEVDGADFRAWGMLKEILTYSRHAVVMTTNSDWKVKKIKTIKDLYIPIKLRQPYINTVVGVAKAVAEKEKLKNVDFSGIGKRDFRNAINVALYGGESYEQKAPFGTTVDFFTKGNLDNIVMKDAAWLFDNAPKFLYGAELFKFYEILEVASRSDVSVLSAVAKGRNPGFAKLFPSYYRRGSTEKNGNDDKKKDN